ncbi:MAG: hypothetical protein Tp138OMZ00d2C19078241_50 [Prokaryotic dsDNA virus sp.]|nr:MAG: hypothetical protein Tp138OMZ00d2C19078241_50 [Prokaryotic dsDNA virus sp.]
MSASTIIIFVMWLFISALMSYDKGASDLRDSITNTCTTEGQFTAFGRTYRCGVVEHETIQQSKARRFEQCRAWLHNALREPHDTN